MNAVLTPAHLPAFGRLFSDIVTVTVPGAPTAGDEVECTDVGQDSVAVVIEDDEDIRGLVGVVLEQAGFTVHAAANGLDGVELVRTHRPTIVTLDISMPGIDGFETAKRIRAISSTYIVMLTARDEEIDTVQGLQSGADDYLTKPFRPRELRARIEAMLRRPRTVAGASAEPAGVPPPTASADPAGESPEWLTHHGLRLHPGMRIVTQDGVEVDLTRSEFEILAELMTAGRRVVSKADLALLLRGERYAGTYVSEHDTRAIEVHVANLRRKLGDVVSRPRWIETIRGVGYRLTA